MIALGTPLILLLALLLDKCFGEPEKYHPLVIYGGFVNKLESRFNTRSNDRGKINYQRSIRLNGVVALVIAIVPFVVVAALIEALVQSYEYLSVAVSAVVLYCAIGWQSLLAHAADIVAPLRANDSEASRLALAKIVSRDTAGLSDEDISKAATESVLENGADAIFSAIFWFCILGLPGVVAYRLSNTLDAMWGYKSDRYLYFGWAAARFDDVLNFIPARLTALSYALVGNTALALSCWRKQGFSWKSPNAGPVMAAGAGALNVALGGAAKYHSQIQFRPDLGPAASGTEPLSARTIERACTLVNKALLLWVVVITVLAWLI